MTEPILHHYPVSPFAEKVRAMLGFKRLAWKSVQIPLIMPKPDVVALTGGYRKTPLLQLGEQAQVMPVGSGLDPVRGELLSASADEIVLRRTDPRAGPRSGAPAANPEP